jgi:hypothetical protein
MSLFSDQLNRRVFVSKAAQSFLGVTALSQLDGKAFAAGKDASPLKQVATARNVIYLYMKGGMSHLDTFDPKPSLDKYDGKAIPSPLKTFESCRIPAPAGFGALAMTVNPPPETAPATSAYFNGSLRPSTSDPRNVSAALSVIAVNPVAPK